MNSLMLAILQAVTAAPTAVPATPPARFADLPNVVVTYYDVSGKNVREVHASIDRQATRDSTTQRAVPATSEWSVNAGVKTSTTGGQCKITGATVNFAAKARMPRLVQAGEEPINPALAASWQLYAAQLEARQVAQLRFAYDRLPQIEQQILASSCADWKKVAASAIDKLKAEKAAAPDTTPPPVLQISEGETAPKSGD